MRESIICAKVDRVDFEAQRSKEKRYAQPPIRFAFNTGNGVNRVDCGLFFNSNNGSSDKENFENGTPIIVEKYKHDINILKIHSKIIEYLKYQETRCLEKYKEQLIEEESKLGLAQTIIERRLTLKNIGGLEDNIKSINEKKEYQEYCEKTRDFLEAYQQLGVLPNVISFVNKTQGQQNLSAEDEDTRSYRHYIIGQYLTMAKQFVPINIVREPDLDEKDSCPECHIAGEHLIDDCYGHIICKNCGHWKVMLKQSTYYQENMSVGIGKNNYEDRSNFHKTLCRFQGLQPNKLPKNFFSELDSYFLSKNLPTRPGNSFSYTQ